MFLRGLVQDLTEAIEQLSRLGTKLAPAKASTPLSGAVAVSSYTQLTANAQVHACLSTIDMAANFVTCVSGCVHPHYFCVQYAVGAAFVVVIGAATAYGLWRRRWRALRSV